VLGINSFGTDYPLRGRRATTQYGDVNCSTRVPNHVAWIRRTIAGESDDSKDRRRDGRDD